MVSAQMEPNDIDYTQKLECLSVTRSHQWLNQADEIIADNFLSLI